MQLRLLSLNLGLLGLRLGLLLLLEEGLLLQVVLMQRVLRQSLLLLELLLLRLRQQTVGRAVGMVRPGAAAGARRQGADHAGTHPAQVGPANAVAGAPRRVIAVVGD